MTLIKRAPLARLRSGRQGGDRGFPGKGSDKHETLEPDDRDGLGPGGPAFGVRGGGRTPL